jgi:GTPase SAR1 family protein
MRHLVNNQYLCAPFKIFMRFIILLSALCGFIFSCGNSSEENQNPESANNSSIIFGYKDYNFPELSAPAKEQAVHWGVLEDFFSEAKNVNGSNYEALRNHSERMKEYSDSLFKNIPDTLNTKPINSRLLVLKTRTELLFQTAHQSIIDSSKIQNSVIEMNIAVKNLITQLNEKFQKDNIDFQRKEDEETELKKQQRYKDSIMNLELQDKNKKKV